MDEEEGHYTPGNIQDGRSALGGERAPLLVRAHLVHNNTCCVLPSSRTPPRCTALLRVRSTPTTTATTMGMGMATGMATATARRYAAMLLLLLHENERTL